MLWKYHGLVFLFKSLKLRRNKCSSQGLIVSDQGGILLGLKLQKTFYLLFKKHVISPI